MNSDSNRNDILNSIVTSGDTFIICPVCGLPLCVGYGKHPSFCNEKCIPRQKELLNGKTFCSRSKENGKIGSCSCNSNKTDGRFEYKLMSIIYQQQSQIEQLEYQIACKEEERNYEVTR